MPTKKVAVKKPRKAAQKTRYTKAQMRVLIAKDALKLLNTRSRKLQMAEGVYVSSTKKSGLFSDLDMDKKVPLERRLNNCKVCALGMLFVAEVDRNDAISCADAEEYTSSWHTGFWVDLPLKRLTKFFTRVQLRIIEGAFEGSFVDFDYDDCPKRLNYSRMDMQINRIQEWFRDPKKRMVEILQNIIKNKGEFDVGQLFDKAHKKVCKNSKKCEHNVRD